MATPLRARHGFLPAHPAERRPKKEKLSVRMSVCLLELVKPGEDEGQGTVGVWPQGSGPLKLARW